MRILFVGDAYSVHTARWTAQLRETGWDIHLFDPLNRLLHEELEHIVIHTGWKKLKKPPGAQVFYRWPFLRGRRFVERNLPAVWAAILPEAGRRLARLIKKLSPDVIHSLGLQNHSEAVLKARDSLGGGLPAPWIYSSRGSDIYFYSQRPEHREPIHRVLASCQFYFCDCQRDVHLARRHGYRGEILGVVPGGGGYPVQEMVDQSGRTLPSQRRTIAVKGLQTDIGNAMVAIDALRKCAEHLRGYLVKVYQAHAVTREAARRLGADVGIGVDIVPRSNYRKIWSLFGESRLALAVSRSDGAPNSMIEAMIMGAFPIQTDPGGATAEWIEHGVNGLIVPDDDPDAIAATIVEALSDAAKVDGAVEINRRLALERVDEKRIRPRVIAAYLRVAEAASNR